jgi:quinone-reactive Ni/Fe-hydrogenase small subunit
MIDSTQMVKKIFTQKSGRVETNKGEVYYNSLFEKTKQRLKDLRAQEPLKDIDMMDIIESNNSYTYASSYVCSTCCRSN